MTWNFPFLLLQPLFSQEISCKGKKYGEEIFNKISQIPTPGSKCCFVFLINGAKHGL